MTPSSQSPTTTTTSFRHRLQPIAVFAGRKLLGVVGTLLALATIVFFLTKLTPGDEAQVAAGEGASPEQVEIVRERLGLSGTLFEQYLNFLGRLMRGDLGTSSASAGSVADAVFGVLPSTTELVVVALLITVTIAMPLAVFSALRHSGAGDALRRVLVILAAGMPTFWLGLMLQNLVATQWRVFPISGVKSTGIQVPQTSGSLLIDSLLAGSPIAFWDVLGHLVLPALVLSVPFIGQLYRVIRVELIRVLEREHITVARASGISGWRLVRKHVLPQIANPALLMIGIEFGGLFGGAILVESIFGRDGIGAFMTNALNQKDTSSVLGGVLVIGIIVVLTSLVVDIVQLIRDPRVRAAQIGGGA
jgi:peptide/nickel transport system permease protein